LGDVRVIISVDKLVDLVVNMVIMGDVADVLGVADIRRSKWDILYEIVYIMGFELNSVKHA